MVDEVAVRNGGARGDERFAADDPQWTPPPGAVPVADVAEVADVSDEDSVPY
jgi:hypothetical protein